MRRGLQRTTEPTEGLSTACQQGLVGSGPEGASPCLLSGYSPVPSVGGAVAPGPCPWPAAIPTHLSCFLSHIPLFVKASLSGHLTAFSRGGRRGSQAGLVLVGAVMCSLGGAGTWPCRVCGLLPWPAYRGRLYGATGGPGCG